MEEAINWNTELRRIDREFDGLPPEPSPEELSARRTAEERAQQLEQQQQQLKQERYTVLGVWARLALVGALSFAVAFWPYSHACGFGLFSYLAVALVIIVGGVWTAVFGWHFRMAEVHGMALAMVLWGLILITAQVLPRNGYARVDPNNPPTWLCRK